MKFLLYVFILYISIFNYYAVPINRFRILEANQFPYQVNADFKISFIHPTIKDHHFHAVITPKITCKNNNTQLLYLYPGFNTRMTNPLKEKDFYVTKLIHTQNMTEVTFKFFRQAHGCQLKIFYCDDCAQKMIDNKPYTENLIYDKKIYLYKKPIVSLIIKSFDNHKGGLTINEPADIECIAEDGFPVLEAKIMFSSQLDVIGYSHKGPTKKYLKFKAKLQDHLTKVSCISDSVIVEDVIKVFHHAENVEIYPYLKYALPNTTFKCKSYGNGYPKPNVSWVITNTINYVPKEYFKIWNEQDSSFLKLASHIPDKSNYNITCRSLNMIPFMDYSGPNKTMNLTIGIDPDAAKIRSSRIWKYSIISIVLILIFFIGLCCIISRFINKKSKRKQEYELTKGYSQQQKLKSDQFDDNQPTAPTVPKDEEQCQPMINNTEGQQLQQQHILRDNRRNNFSTSSTKPISSSRCNNRGDDCIV